ncbi:sporulation integral membrane protein YlbJ [Gottschalkia purinilytica]|uniref:Sporulation integral membrane protein YlbJ n=1 Tax=Gottschalkia purinilytica TaxID=1503 RepID=A0A0L0WB57_GOTPU|nr:sporulation integral membrane protein YlbJ [Gottschalkia purinilytica]KNF08764.1 sporulation integral membrane protein YlbJ [Gottschalkia purinilytica]
MTTLILTTILIFILIALILLIKNKSYIKTIIISSISIIIITIIVMFPKNSVDAALRGLLTWTNVVIPSLFPFFIGSEVLIGLGIVDFIGTLLKPIMYPLFGVPGEGSFVFAMSVTSGYPVGANLTAKLRSQNIITKTEAQRLIAFCSTSGPLFIIGAVSVGMLKNPRVGSLLAIAHYLGAISVGLIFKFYKKDKRKKTIIKKSNYIKEAFISLIKAREKDGRSFSTLLADSITSAFNSMFMVGGFIILYSVVIEAMKITNIIDFISDILIKMVPFSINSEIMTSFVSGLIEMTNGCKMVSDVDSASLIIKICAISFLIAWSGFSVHSQVMSMINNTDISYRLYILSKLLHGLCSSVYSYFIYKLIFNSSSSTISLPATELESFANWLLTLKFSFQIEFIIIISIILISLVLGTLYTLTHKLSK